MLQRQGIIPFFLNLIEHRRKQAMKPQLEAAKQQKEQEQMAHKMLLAAYGDNSAYEADLPDYGTTLKKTLLSMNGGKE